MTIFFNGRMIHTSWLIKVGNIYKIKDEYIKDIVKYNKLRRNNG